MSESDLKFWEQRVRNILIFSVTNLLMMLAPGAQAASTDQWVVYQGDVGHTGYIAQTLMPNLVALRWSLNVQPGSSGAAPAGTSGIAISDGLVITTPYTYFNQNGAPLVAQRIADGKVMWSIDFGQLYSVNQPAVDNKVIYLQSCNGSATYLHAYQVDGTFLWRAPFNAQSERYLGPIIVNGNIYFDGGTYGGLYSFDESNGAQQWFTGDVNQYALWSPTWNNGSLLVFTDALYTIAPDTGLVISKIPLYGEVGGINEAPVVVGNYAYVTFYGNLVAFDLLNQVVAWQQSINAIGQVATDGTDLFVNAGGSLSVRNPVTGNQLWSWVPTATLGIASNIVVTKSHVIASDLNATYLVNRATHLTDATIPYGGPEVAYGDDTVVIASDLNGKVAAYYLPTDEIFSSFFQ